MKRNIGKIDMMIRFALAFFLLYIGFYENPLIVSPSAKKVLGIIAIIPLLTGMTRFCPLYMLAGIDTRKK